ncbi:short-chain dehydrogenase [Rickettsiales bacterium]|nr:short-chain dehydrogenase [Rickettsiales bacterium]
MNMMRQILITGASSGLGAALAENYAKDKSRLLLIGRNKERLENVASRCREIGASVVSATIDVTDEEQMKSWIEKNAPIDLVIANAGISGGMGGMDKAQESTQQVKEIFDINIYGIVNTIHPCIELMTAQKSGQIAIVSSLAGLMGWPGAPAYSASKATIKAYGEALRGNLAKYSIKVTVICPGFIRTAMTVNNSFPMPLIMDANKAANIIKNKLRRGPARIAFPWLLYFLISTAAYLPPALTEILLRILPGKEPLK